MLLEAIAKELENNNNQTAVVRIISKTGFLHDFCSPSSPHQVRVTCTRELRQRWGWSARRARFDWSKKITANHLMVRQCLHLFDQSNRTLALVPWRARALQVLVRCLGFSADE